MRPMTKPSFLIRIMLIVLFSGTFMSGMAQKTVMPDPRLSECFDAASLTEMQTSKPDLVSYYNFILNKSFYITSLKSEKPIVGTDIHQVKMKSEYSSGKTQYFNADPKTASASSINIMKYDFKQEQKKFVTYIWKEAGIAVIFYPKENVIMEYNSYKKTNNIQ
ncbi:MAG: hypothetical protein V2A54_08845 [Bacteroidota bacterium]